MHGSNNYSRSNAPTIIPCRNNRKFSSISVQLLWERSDPVYYYFPRRIHFRGDTAVVPNSFVIDSALIGGRRRVKFQPHKLKPLLMASSPEQETHPYSGEIIPRCTRIDSTKRRIALLSGRYGELWMRSNASTVKNARDPPDARRIAERNLLSSDMTAVSQLLLICA